VAQGGGGSARLQRRHTGHRSVKEEEVPVGEVTVEDVDSLLAPASLLRQVCDCAAPGSPLPAT
jgi:hypothetical protein